MKPSGRAQEVARPVACRCRWRPTRERRPKWAAPCRTLGEPRGMVRSRRDRYWQCVCKWPICVLLGFSVFLFRGCVVWLVFPHIIFSKGCSRVLQMQRFLRENTATMQRQNPETRISHSAHVKRQFCNVITLSGHESCDTVSKKALWWALLYSSALTTICEDEVQAPRSCPTTVRQGNGGLYSPLLAAPAPRPARPPGLSFRPVT